MKFRLKNVLEIKPQNGFLGAGNEQSCHRAGSLSLPSSLNENCTSFPYRYTHIHKVFSHICILNFYNFHCFYGCILPGVVAASYLGSKN